MKSAAWRKLEALKQDAESQRVAGDEEPDFTGWTRKEIVDWRVARLMRMDLGVAIAKANASPPAETSPTTLEQFAAWEARDAAILAERAAKAAADQLAEYPGSAAAQINARATREAADKAARAAEEAERIAAEAKLRPPPEPTPEAAEPAKAKAAPKPRRKRAPKLEPKAWWEEKAHWRLRPSWEDEDARRGRPLHECTHEYDPLADGDDPDADEVVAY